MRAPIPAAMAAVLFLGGAAAHPLIVQADAPAPAPAATVYVYLDQFPASAWRESNGVRDGGVYSHGGNVQGYTGLQMDAVCWGTFTLAEALAYWEVVSNGHYNADEPFAGYIPWAGTAGDCIAAGGAFAASDERLTPARLDTLDDTIADTLNQAYAPVEPVAGPVVDQAVAVVEDLLPP